MKYVYILYTLQITVDRLQLINKERKTNSGATYRLINHLVLIFKSQLDYAQVKPILLRDLSERRKITHIENRFDRVCDYCDCLFIRVHRHTKRVRSNISINRKKSGLTIGIESYRPQALHFIVD